MSAHVFHEIFLHANWHTKGDRAMLAGDMEGRVQQNIRQRCRQAKGVYLHAARAPRVGWHSRAP